MKRHKKKMDRAIEEAIKRGWTVSMTKKNHLMLKPPRGMRDPRQPERLQPPILFAGTPSDSRSDLNGYAALKRAGIEF